MSTKQTKWNRKVRIARRQGGKLIDRVFLTPCQYCGNRFLLQHLTFDHVIRKRDGGTDRDDNLVLACRLCNQGREPGFKNHFKALINHHRQTAR